LTLVVNDFGEYVFVNDLNEEIFSLGSLYMIDSNGEISYDIEFNVVEVKTGEYDVEIAPSDEFLQKATYPVKIDPTITDSTQTMNIIDTYVTTKNSINHSNENYLYISDDTNDDFVTLMDFDIPSELIGKKISYASLTLRSYMKPGNRMLNMYINKQPFNSTISYFHDKPEVEDFGSSYLFTLDQDYYSFNMTEAVRYWQENGFNSVWGVSIEDEDATTYYGANIVFSSEMTIVAPQIEIGYIDDSGMKSYWTYNSQEVGAAGSGYISDFTQNLFFSRSDIFFETDLQSLSVGFKYSNFEINNNYGYGKGWNVDYNIQLMEDNDNDSDYYIIDSTGNKTYYYSTSVDPRLGIIGENTYDCWVADDGSGNKLVFHYYSSTLIYMYVLTKDNQRLDFSLNNGYLESISSLDNNLVLNIERDPSTSSKIDYIEDTHGNMLDFEYEGGDYLKYITLKTEDDGIFNSLERVYYKYEFGYLKNAFYLSDYNQDGDLSFNITAPDYTKVDHLATYTYSYNKLDSAYTEYIDSDTTLPRKGEEIQYTYYTSTNQVERYESFYNSNKLSTINFDQSSTSTKITDHDTNFIKYNFDSYGHTVNIIDKYANVTFYDYRNVFEDSLPNYELNHTITTQANPQDLTYSIEDDIVFGFENSLEGWSSDSGNNTTTVNYKCEGSYSLSVDLISEIILSLDEGLYSFSASIYSDTSVDGAYISASTSTSIEIDNKNSWERVNVLIYVDTAKNITFGLHNTTNGNVYFDDIVISYEDQNDKVNFLNNPSFETGDTLNWTKSHPNDISVESYSTVNIDNTYTNLLGDYFIKVSGNFDTLKTVTQTINVEDLDIFSSSGGRIYVGGWVNTYTAPNTNSNNGSDSILWMKVTAKNGSTYIDNSVVYFDQNMNGWQFSYAELTIFQEATDIVIEFCYKGTGEVIFDGATVFLDASELIINYDEDHNNRISSVLLSNGDIYVYNYDNDNDLTYSSITLNEKDPVETDFTGNQLNYIEKDNVRVTYTYTDYGQKTDVSTWTDINNDGNLEKCYSNLTSYTLDNQYIIGYTNEFGKSTSYDVDITTGLLQYIQNANGDKIQYEYYDNGSLKRVFIGESNESNPRDVEYVYNEAYQLTEIILDTNYKYTINYDDYGRMSSVYINAQEIMSYDYSYYMYDHDLLDTQTYGNGNIIFFIYNDNDQIHQIYFAPDLTDNNDDGIPDGLVQKYEYDYDTNDRLVYYKDVLENYTEHYNYDKNGNLVQIQSSLGNEINYVYDEDGNISNIEYSFIDVDSLTTYNYDHPTSNDKYYETVINNGNQDIKKIYYYEEDALHRLSQITFMSDSTTVMNQSLNYYLNTERVQSVIFKLNDDVLTQVKYMYTFDDLGNINTEAYYKGDMSTPTIFKEYFYDDYNQLIKENSRDNDVLIENSYAEKNYSRYYYYDENGNIIYIRSYKYGDGDYIESPSYYIENFGSKNCDMKYNSTNNYGDVYNLALNTTMPQLDFEYYEIDGGILLFSVNELDGDPADNDLFSQFNALILPPIPQEIPNMTTTLLSSTLDNTKTGFYYNLYEATDNGLFTIRFRIIINVGNAQVGYRTPEEYVSYNYNSQWMDQLESYTVLKDGTTYTSQVTYDNQGNPEKITNFKFKGITYNYADLTWEGRSLKSISVYDSSLVLKGSIVYTYNDQGLRIKKVVEDTVSTITYEYMLSGSTVLSERVTTVQNSVTSYYYIIYNYDVDGSLIGFSYQTDLGTVTDYFYIKNLQGDVTHVVDINNNIIVEYFYDAYGNVLDISGSHKTTLGEYNSMRYRSYYYDIESSLYYLQSRYYNPEIGRFISSDGLLGQLGNVQSHNMYAYCANNPVMYSDISGYAPKWIDTLAWIGVGLVVAAAVVLTAGAVGFVIGGTLGAIAYGASFGIAIGAVIGTSIGVAGGIVKDVIEGNSFGTSIWSGAKLGFGLGTMIGCVTGGIVGYSAAVSVTGLSNPVVWSGLGRDGASIAASAAAQQGSITIGQTFAGSYLSTMTKIFGYSLTHAAWANVSGIMVSTTTVTSITLFSGTAISATSIYAMYEYPILFDRGIKIVREIIGV
jgi:RHS repeat-associated protein